MKSSPRSLYAVMAIGGITGIIASFIQLIDKMKLMENSDAVLTCNINSVFSCSSVLSAWQSSLFGFPNAVLCLMLFVIFTTVAVAGLSGGVLPRRFRLAVQGLTLFTLCFAIWFLLQSIYVINALCILCMFCFAGLLLLNWGWLRFNAAELPLSGTTKKHLEGWVSSGVDTFIWTAVAFVMAVLMFQRFM